MKKIILIHAHNNIKLLNDLIDVLFSENHTIYVNVDLKSKIDVRYINDKARLIKQRINIHWGRFSQVMATINSLIEIEENEKNYEHVIFISGQDFPIVNNNVIDSFLVPGQEYIDNVPICENGWAVNDRYEKFYLGNNKSQQIIALFINSIATRTIGKRRMPHNYKSYGGSQWWMLTNECIKYILDFVQHNKKFVNFFRFVIHSDEMFFQTIIMNSRFKIML
jgi:core-2/I-Branching enzyme